MATFVALVWRRAMTAAWRPQKSAFSKVLTCGFTEDTHRVAHSNMLLAKDHGEGSCGKGEKGRSRDRRLPGPLHFLSASVA
jgi:hypothetical protein